MCKEKGIYILSLIFSVFLLSKFSGTCVFSLTHLSGTSVACNLEHMFSLKIMVFCSCWDLDSFHKSVIFFSFVYF